MDLVPTNFSSLDKDVIENGSGTHSLPVLVGIAPGEKGRALCSSSKSKTNIFSCTKNMLELNGWRSGAASSTHQPNVHFLYESGTLTIFQLKKTAFLTLKIGKSYEMFPYAAYGNISYDMPILNMITLYKIWKKYIKMIAFLWIARFYYSKLDWNYLS